MRKARFLFIGVAFASAIVFSAILVTWTVAESSSTTPADPDAGLVTARLSSDSLAIAQHESGPVRMVRFTLFEEGIFPRELRVEKGLVNLAIEDKTNSSTGLVIERLTGNERTRVGEVHRFPNHWRGRGLIRLTLGQYRVYDASRPGNSATLVVAP